MGARESVEGDLRSRDFLVPPLGRGHAERAAGGTGRLLVRDGDAIVWTVVLVAELDQEPIGERGPEGTGRVRRRQRQARISTILDALEEGRRVDPAMLVRWIHEPFGLIQRQVKG